MTSLASTKMKEEVSTEFSKQPTEITDFGTPFSTQEEIHSTYSSLNPITKSVTFTSPSEKVSSENTVLQNTTAEVVEISTEIPEVTSKLSSTDSHHTSVTTKSPSVLTTQLVTSGSLLKSSFSTQTTIQEHAATEHTHESTENSAVTLKISTSEDLSTAFPKITSFPLRTSTFTSKFHTPEVSHTTLATKSIFDTSSESLMSSSSAEIMSSSDIMTNKHTSKERLEYTTEMPGINTNFPTEEVHQSTASTAATTQSIKSPEHTSTFLSTELPHSTIDTESTSTVPTAFVTLVTAAEITSSAPQKSQESTSPEGPEQSSENPKMTTMFFTPKVLLSTTAVPSTSKMTTESGTLAAISEMTSLASTKMKEEVSTEFSKQPTEITDFGTAFSTQEEIHSTYSSLNPITKSVTFTSPSEKVSSENTVLQNTTVEVAEISTEIPELTSKLSSTDSHHTSVTTKSPSVLTTQLVTSGSVLKSSFSTQTTIQEHAATEHTHESTENSAVTLKISTSEEDLSTAFPKITSFPLRTSTFTSKFHTPEVSHTTLATKSIFDTSSESLMSSSSAEIMSSSDIMTDKHTSKERLEYTTEMPGINTNLPTEEVHQSTASTAATTQSIKSPEHTSTFLSTELPHSTIDTESTSTVPTAFVTLVTAAEITSSAPQKSQESTSPEGPEQSSENPKMTTMFSSPKVLLSTTAVPLDLRNDHRIRNSGCNFRNDIFGFNQNEGGSFH